MTISGRSSAYLIAEIGINHGGSVHTCSEMIRAAADSGADAVKLQTVDADKNYAINTESYKVYKECELTRHQTAQMFSLANKLNIGVFSTVGDLETVHWVNELDPVAWKISSGLLTHIPLIHELTQFGKTLFMSTGMASKLEIDHAVKAATDNNSVEVILFQCTSIYPTPNHMLNLRAIRWMEKEYNLPVGFSDHSVNKNVSGLAIAAGAIAIEKHFTLDTSLPGLDHSISANPAGFKEMVVNVRAIEAMMGRPGKTVSAPLRNVRKKMLRSVVSAGPLRKGHTLRLADLAVKRTHSDHKGIKPELTEKVIGRKINTALRLDDPITLDLLE